MMAPLTGVFWWRQPMALVPGLYSIYAPDSVDCSPVLTLSESESVACAKVSWLQWGQWHSAVNIYLALAPSELHLLPGIGDPQRPREPVVTPWSYQLTLFAGQVAPASRRASSAYAEYAWASPRNETGEQELKTPDFPPPPSIQIVTLYRYIYVQHILLSPSRAIKISDMRLNMLKFFRGQLEIK